MIWVGRELKVLQLAVGLETSRTIIGQAHSTLNIVILPAIQIVLKVGKNFFYVKNLKIFSWYSSSLFRKPTWVFYLLQFSPIIQ